VGNKRKKMTRKGPPLSGSYFQGKPREVRKLFLKKKRGKRGPHLKKPKAVDHSLYRSRGHRKKRTGSTLGRVNEAVSKGRKRGVMSPVRRGKNRHVELTHRRKKQGAGKNIEKLELGGGRKEKMRKWHTWTEHIFKRSIGSKTGTTINRKKRVRRKALGEEERRVIRSRENLAQITEKVFFIRTFGEKDEQMSP